MSQTYAIQHLPIERVNLNPGNPRFIKDQEFKNLVKSLKECPELFEARPLLCNSDLTILGGNMRYRAALELRYTQVPVIVMEGLTEEQERGVVIRDNGSFGAWDFSELANSWSDLPLADWGVSLPEDWLAEPEQLPAAEEGEFNGELPKEPITVLGDLYELNGHRLHCADSTDSDAVARLMDGKKADMVFTSPPYNQGGGGMKYDYNGAQTALYKHKDDKRTKEEYYDFLISVLKAVYINCTDEAALLWNVAYNANARDDYGKIVFSEDHGFTVKETIIWDKGHAFPTASKGILSRRAEFIFLLSKGEKYYTNQGANEPWFNYWSISSSGAQTESHAAAFPVGLPLEGIQKFSTTGAVVYEPFCGTGTTLVASEQTGRLCYGQEFDPSYTDVIVRRWVKYMKDNSRPYTVKRNGELLSEQEIEKYLI